MIRGTGGDGLYRQFNMPDRASVDSDHLDYSAWESWRSWEDSRDGNTVGGGWPFWSPKLTPRWYDFWRFKRDGVDEATVPTVVDNLIERLRNLRNCRTALDQLTRLAQLGRPVDLALVLVYAFREFGPSMFATTGALVSSFGPGGLDMLGEEASQMIDQGFLRENFEHDDRTFEGRENEQGNPAHPAIIRADTRIEATGATLAYKFLGEMQLVSSATDGGLVSDPTSGPPIFQSRSTRIWPGMMFGAPNLARALLSGRSPWPSGTPREFDAIVGSREFQERHASVQWAYVRAAEAEILQSLVIGPASELTDSASLSPSDVPIPI